MARRGFTVLFTLLGMAVFFSIAAFVAMYLLFGREPAVAARSTLVLQVGGDLAELAPADVFGYLRGNRMQTVRSVIDNLRKAKVDSRVRRRAPQASRLQLALLGQGAGNPGRRDRIPQVGQAGLRVSRKRRRSRVLPRIGG